MGSKQKIIGYRELDENEIARINGVKTLGQKIGVLITLMQEDESVDQRWLAIATTDLQTGLMALTRSIAKPDGF